jgi:flagellar basal body-associated protein FliL
VLKDKKVLGGGAVLFVALFWFYIKPHYMTAAPPPVPPTEKQIAEAARPKVVLGRPVEPKAAAAWTGLKMNLKSSADSPHYALVQIELEFADPKHTYIGVVAPAALDAKNAKFADDLTPELHKVLDATTTFFGSKTVEQISSTDGRDQLKAELIAAINAQLREQKVEAVYFPTLITQ